MLAVVTGGLGFIGSHVVELLVAQGWRVVVVDNLSTGSKANAICGAEYRIESLTETPDALLRAADYVFHLAALPRILPSFQDPLIHEKENVSLTIELMQRLIGSPVLKKLVFSSSSAIYGNPCQIPTSEDCQISPLSPYAVQKYAAEQHCLMLGQFADVPVIALRYFNPYGSRSFNPNNPYNAYSSVVGIFSDQKAMGRPLTITGDGSQERDFIHVADVARANLAAALSPLRGRIYNVGGGTTLSVLKLAKLFSHPYIFIEARPGEARITHADISRIKRELGWVPTRELSKVVGEPCAA
jgi:UDP-glucose 4-epimerase